MLTEDVNVEEGKVYSYIFTISSTGIQVGSTISKLVRVEKLRGKHPD